MKMHVMRDLVYKESLWQRVRVLLKTGAMLTVFQRPSNKRKIN